MLRAFKRYHLLYRGAACLLQSVLPRVNFCYVQTRLNPGRPRRNRRNHCRFTGCCPRSDSKVWGAGDSIVRDHMPLPQTGPFLRDRLPSRSQIAVKPPSLPTGHLCLHRLFESRIARGFTLFYVGGWSRARPCRCVKSANVIFQTNYLFHVAVHKPGMSRLFEKSTSNAWTQVWTRRYSWV